MLSGIKALQNIDQTLQSIRNEVVRLDSQLSQITNSLTDRERHRLSVVKDIATVRLVEIDKGSLLADLSAADQEAVRLLQQRDKALTEIADEITSLNQKITLAEQAREVELAKVNECSQKIVDTESAAQQQLSSDQDYLHQLTVAQQAESVAEQAAEKVENANRAMQDKAKPYQEDELFMYLWDRGFGTTEYKGGLLGRFLDSWVARIINYSEARVNYWNLVEIPKRLQAHAQAKANLADEEAMALQQLELDALAEAGVVALEEQLSKLRTSLDESDDELEQFENSLNDALERRALFIAGEDEFIKKCIARLSEAIHHQDLESIHRYVQQTSSPTDDQLVVELVSLDDHLQSLRGDLGAIRKLHDNKLMKLKELEQVRRSFKDSRFDDVRSGFNNGSLLASVLAQFIQGVVTGSDVWQTIRRNQHYRDMGSLPDFGSDGLGTLGDILGSGSIGRSSKRRNRRASTWHWPKPRRGGGGFNFPRGGSGGGGGFRTGGGV